MANFEKSDETWRAAGTLNPGTWLDNSTSGGHAYKKHIFEKKKKKSSDGPEKKNNLNLFLITTLPGREYVYVAYQFNPFRTPVPFWGQITCN